MRIALTGTPGTGKTTVASRLEDAHTVIHLSDVIDDEDLVSGYDPARDTEVVDVDALEAHLAGVDDAIFESHLAHQLSVDRVIVLRCHPDELTERLRDRGVSPRSVRENAESEALDLVLAEAVQRHDTEHVYEIDTTDRTIEETVDDVESALRGEGEFAVGLLDFTDYL